MFRAVMGAADKLLVLSRREGQAGQGIPRGGTRPFRFQTRFGTVALARTRIRPRADGSLKVPAATTWRTGHHEELTRGLRPSLGERMLEDSTRVSRRDVCHSAGEEDPACRSTFWDVVPEQGSELVEAMRPRVRHERADAPRARKALLPCAAEAAEAEGVASAAPGWGRISVNRRDRQRIGTLWEGKVDEAMGVWRGVLGRAKNGGAVEDLIGYLGSHRPSIPDYRARQKTGSVGDKQPGGEVQRLGGVGPAPGSWDEVGAARGHLVGGTGGGASELEAVRQNGDWAGWWQDRSLPAWKFPEPLRRTG